MGVKCQIIREKQSGKLIEVEAPNGKPSLLFRNLLDITGSEDSAINLWTLSYTDEFQAVTSGAPLDFNGEHFTDSVLNFARNHAAKEKSLSPEVIHNVYYSLLNTPIYSLQHLYDILRETFLVDGSFSVDEARLRKSKLYTGAEITNILASPQVRNDIKATMEQIEAHFINNESDADVNSLLALKEIGNIELLKDTTKVGMIGKFLNIHPTEVHNELAKQLAGVKDRSAFDNIVANLPDTPLTNLYKNNTSFADDMFNHYSKLQRIPKYVITDGVLGADLENDTLSTFNQVLKTGVSSMEAVLEINDVLEFPSFLWEVSEDEVRQALEEVSLRTEQFGLDLSMLPSTYGANSSDEIKDFLALTSRFLTGLSLNSLDTSDVESYAASYDAFFNISPSQREVFLTMEDPNLSYMAVEHNLSEEELFETNSLIQVRDGVYQKVEAMPLDELYEQMYEIVQEDPTILPQATFYPVGFDSENNFSPERVINPEKKEDVLQAIKRFFLKKTAGTQNGETKQAILLFKYAFKHPAITQKVVQPNLAVFSGNHSYLTGEFISDFYVQQLKGKRTNSTLYENILKHFHITPKGIRLKENDETTKKLISTLLKPSPLRTNLKNYSILSKDPSMNSLFPEEVITPTLPLLRNLYTNSPTLVNQYTGEFTTYGDTLLVANKSDGFIRIGDTIYERNGTVGSGTIYSPVIGYTHPNYNVVQEIGQPSEVSIVKGETTSSKTKVKQFLSKEEQSSLENELGACN